MVKQQKETLGLAVEHAFTGRGIMPYAKTAEASRAEAEKLKDFLANQKGNATDGREFDLNEPLDALLSDPPGFVEDVLVRVRSCQAGKPEMVRRVIQLFEYLKTVHSVTLDTSSFALLDWRNEDERLLMMLKYVHDNSHSRQEIADTLGVTPRTVSDDISKLRDGYHFLGTEIRVEDVKAGNFGSDVHPLFLAMNTADIYTLTVGLTLLSRGTVFESRANLLAGQVYSQLSVKAKALVDARAQEADVSIYEKRAKFQNSEMCITERLEANKPFTYFLREPKPCKVTYRSKGGEKTVTGILRLAGEGYDCRKVVVVSGVQKLELEIEEIKEVARLESDEIQQ